MAICPKCGTEIPEGVKGCPACGEGSIARIVLTGSSGKISSGIDIDIGQTLASRVCGEESRFFDNRQFSLHKGDDAWTIIPNADAKNETFFNGTALTGEAKLDEGAEISLKGKAGFIRVSFL